MKVAFPERISVIDLSDKEQLKFATLLKTYFSWLGTDEECESSDVVEELQHLYSALPQVD